MNCVAHRATRLAAKLFEPVIRDENGLNRIREYIRYNPLKWTEDSPREMFLYLLQQIF